ncbi:hypothetical protein EAI89_08795 [Eubacterium sp. am_0171]|nr:hypothetical protein EAI89_08795 [Eubacterium sp. am_0171]
MLLRKQHLASQSDVVFIKRAYGALYASGKGHRSFPGRGRSPVPDRLGASWVERAGRGRGARDRVGRIFFQPGLRSSKKTNPSTAPVKKPPGQRVIPAVWMHQRNEGMAAILPSAHMPF